MKIKSLIRYFSIGERLLWSCSMLSAIVAFCIFDRENFLTLIVSLIGITALIFCAKGNPIGQAIIIVFGGFYGYISYTSKYYGEMITYLGMTVPMAVLALISWLKNPFEKDKPEVRINRLKLKEIVFMFFLTAVVTFGFYFILKILGTANLLFSTISIATSFVAVYLTFRRSPFFALGYALNDVVLIVLWVMATLKDTSYVSVVICFAVFLINDLYGFFNWLKMLRHQEKVLKEKSENIKLAYDN